MTGSVKVRLITAPVPTETMAWPVPRRPIRWTHARAESIPTFWLPDTPSPQEVTR